jgi:HPt (histidine-containing phosphotransfer) domain-containing protein
MDQDFFTRLHALNDKFAAGVPETLARLGTVRRRFKPEAPDPELVKEMHQVLHTIAGSAATFGFRVLGQQARQLEQRLRVLMAFDVIAVKDWDNWLASLDTYLAWGAHDPRASDYVGELAQ